MKGGGYEEFATLVLNAVQAEAVIDRRLGLALANALGCGCNAV